MRFKIRYSSEFSSINFLKEQMSFLYVNVEKKGRGIIYIIPRAHYTEDNELEKF